MRAFLLESLELHSRSFTKYLQRFAFAKIPTDEASFEANPELGKKEMLNALPSPAVPVLALDVTLCNKSSFIPFYGAINMVFDFINSFTSYALFFKG